MVVVVMVFVAVLWLVVVGCGWLWCGLTSGAGFRRRLCEAGRTAPSVRMGVLSAPLPYLLCSQWNVLVL
jgi:hypothetical protein